MPRRIKVEVRKNGQVMVEFSGFEGETCHDEAQTLQQTLRELGLWAIPVTVTPKTSAQIEEETGVEKPKDRKVPVG